MKNVFLYDTTLRDGTQSEEISLSVLDKIAIAEKLDEFGIHYIEGGYPGSNPKDKEFFERARKMRWKNSAMCAFGMTRRVGKKVDEDANMKSLVAAGTPVITVVGKSWDFHVIEALRTAAQRPSPRQRGKRRREGSAGFRGVRVGSWLILLMRRFECERKRYFCAAFRGAAPAIRQ